MDGARRNVEAEIPGWDFDGVRRAARQSWNEYLAKIDIETEDEDQRTMFYTALYHTGMQPNLFTDADGRYFGMDLKVHQGSVEEPVYTIFSLWDTFRAYHPLMTIINPDLNQAFIRSLIQKAARRRCISHVGIGGQLYGHDDRLSCCLPCGRCLYEGLSRL